MATSNKSHSAKKSKPAAKPVRKPSPAADPKSQRPAAAAKTVKPARPAPAAPALPSSRPADKAKVWQAPVAVRPSARQAGETRNHATPADVKFSDKDMLAFRRELMAMRDRLTGQVDKMRQAALRRDDEVNPEEDGTDAFDRLFTLERAGSDQEIIFRIDESLRAIEESTYGVCESCGGLIEKPRLQALPFAKNCVACQSEMERGRNGTTARRIMP